MHHAADFITAHMKIDVLVDIAGALERCTVRFLVVGGWVLMQYFSQLGGLRSESTGRAAKGDRKIPPLRWAKAG